MGSFETWPGEGAESPFRRRLVECEEIRSRHGRLRVFEDDLRFVIRIVSSLQIEGAPDLLSTSRRLHAELEATGVAIPPRLYVVGSRHSDGRPQGFVVARTVTGSNVSGAPLTGDPSVASGMDSLCVRLVGYYEAKYQSGGAFLPDIRLDQFVYGHLDGAPARLWFVDLDPGFVRIGPRTADALQLASLHWRIAEVANMIVGLEVATGRRLEAARAELGRLLHSPMFEHPSAAGRPAVVLRVLRQREAFDGGEWMQEQFRHRDGPADSARD
jgi:hypothetical protein